MKTDYERNKNGFLDLEAEKKLKDSTNKRESFEIEAVVQFCSSRKKRLAIDDEESKFEAHKKAIESSKK